MTTLPRTPVKSKHAEMSDDDELSHLEARLSAAEEYNRELRQTLEEHTTMFNSLNGDLGSLKSGMERLLRQAAPSPALGANLPSGATQAPVVPVPATSAELPGVNNGNIAKQYPELDAQAEAYLSSSGGVQALRAAAHVPLGESPASVTSTPQLLEYYINCRRGKSANTTLMLDEQNRLVLAAGSSSSSLSAARTMLSPAKLRQEIPHMLTFEEAWSNRTDALINAGALSQAAQHFYAMYKAELLRHAAELLNTAGLATGMELFLCLERELTLWHFKHYVRFAEADRSNWFPAAIVSRVYAEAAIRGTNEQRYSQKHTSAQAQGSSKPRGTYMAAAVQAIPEEFRQEACAAFWKYGNCSRASCRWSSSGHKCLRCGKPDHGGAQCNAK